MKDEKMILIEGPLAFMRHGRDTVAWRWFLNGHEVVVEISGTAMEAVDEHLPERVATARRTQGRSEIERMADWEVPLDLVTLTTEDD